MEIGIYIDDLWQAAVLTVTDSALLIKCQSKTMIITFKEIVYYKINNDGYINIGYMERLNGDAWKKDIFINGDNNSEILKKIENKRNGTTEESEQYTPPKENAYTEVGGYAIPKENAYHAPSSNSNEQLISDENIQKQEEMNKNMQKPKKGVSIIVYIIIGILLFSYLSYSMKSLLLNSKENLFTGGGSMWQYKPNESMIFAYQFKEENNCKYIHKTSISLTEKKCTYKTSGHRIDITLETGEVHSYKWSLKYKLKFGEGELLKPVLYLEGDNKQEYTNEIYQFNN